MGIIFLSAVGLSLSFCAAPGVVTAEAIRRGFARGFWPAFLVELGSLVGDGAWAIVALAGVGFIAQNTLARLLLGIAGVALLATLAWNALKDARQGIVPVSKETPSRGDFATGAFLSLANPFEVAFWMGVSGSVVSTTVLNPQAAHLAIFFIGFMAGGFLWCIMMAGLVGWGRQLLKPAFFRWVNLGCGLLLFAFGALLLWSTVHSLLTLT